MTQSRALKTVSLITGTIAAASLLMQACGGGAMAQSAGDADPIEGVWESSVTIKDCTTGAVLRTFKGEGLFHRGGSLTADNSLPRATQGVALGNWKRDAGSAYTANARFLRFNPDGSLAGAQTLKRVVTLAADSNGFAGSVSGQVLDAAGVVLQPICGSETAVRIY
ncbi:MAG: hypothetical protein ABIX46_07250 [Burkholderiaceae bacterium]